MRFIFRAALANNAQEWRLEVECPALQAGPLVPARTLRRTGAGRKVFPQPPDGDVMPPADLARLYGRILSGAPEHGAPGGMGDVETFGRYLFATLLGDTLWQDLCNRAGAEPVEIALAWGDADWELSRLPWEMMHGPQHFLAGKVGHPVAITRLVAGATSRAYAGELAPRVLFVVGADADDAAIQPGAEYVGLLRQIEKGHLSFDTQVVLRASNHRLKEALRRLRPSVVHFICHGGITADTGAAYLSLASDDPREKNLEQRPAGQLVSLLDTGQGLPPVVVLNACYTGAVPFGEQGAPLAVELVKGGVPVVVAMAGRVADRACRLFTRRFYEALLQGTSVVAAAAAARRDGFEHWDEARESADWALPALYIAESYPEHITFDPALKARAIRLAGAARAFRKQNNPAAFCARFEFLDAYREMMGGVDEQEGLRVLAVESLAAPRADEKPRYGKTRLLEELAATAASEGHVPCLVALLEGQAPPNDALAVGIAFVQAIRQTCTYFGIAEWPFELVKLKRALAAGDPAGLHATVQNEIDLQPASPGGFQADFRVVRAAIRVDLAELAARAAQALGLAAPPHVLVLVDDLHRFGEGAPALVAMLDPQGLGAPGAAVPVVFTYSSDAGERGSPAAHDAIKAFVRDMRRYAAHPCLEAFGGPPKKSNEYRVAYQQFLLHYDPPYVVRYRAPGDPESAFEELHECIRGVPSALGGDNVELRGLIRGMAKFKGLELARDEDQMSQPQGPAGHGN